MINSFTWAPLRKSLSKFGQLNCEARGYADSLGDLVANLHYFSGKVDAETMLVLVPRRSFLWYLSMLKSFGLIARIPVVVISSGKQLSELLSKVLAGDKQMSLIVGRKLYFRFHARLRGRKFEKRIIII